MVRGHRLISVREALSVLGLGSNADPRGLRRAYLRAVKAAHPDKPGGDAERLRVVIEAYEVLRSRPPPAVGPPPRPASQRLEITPTEAVVGGVRSVMLDGVGEAAVRLPPGLRTGDRVGVSGVAMIVIVAGRDGAAVVGDHLCLTVQVDPAVMAVGGCLEVSTPTGNRQIHLTRQDVLRGLVRAAGGGLPARGRHAQGHLFVRLEVAAAGRFETPSRSLLRRFAAAWAA